MVSLWFIAIVIGVISAIVTPFKIRAAMRRRLRAGSFTLAHGAEVTVVGTIRDTKELVESPLSTRRGVFVYVRAELPETGPSGRIEAKRMVPFELDTHHGVVLVDASEADITLKLMALSPRSPDRERAFVASKGRGPEVAAVATFRELVLSPGARIAVAGVAMIEEELQGERGYRDPVASRIRIVPPARHPLTIGEPADRY